MNLVRWSNLGFPTKEGHYHLDGMDIWVNNFNIRQVEEWLASGNDDALFELVIIERIAGPKKYRLGALQK